MPQINNYFYICGSLDEAQRNPGLPMPLKSPRIPFHFIRATKRIAWNGKALSRPAVACNTKTFNLPQRRGVAEVYFGLHAGAALAANSVSCIRVVVRG